MQTKVLIVAVVKNIEGEILLRKKPDGSPPYKETWYIFGAELIPGVELQKTLADHIHKQAGIRVENFQQISWDTEVKKDLDNIIKQFVYLDVLCDYAEGDLTLSEGVERLEWVPTDKLKQYDNVPPSVELFKKLGFID